MSRPDDDIRRLESLADRAWPPAEVVPCDGWELRATGPGIGRRVNSVATTAAGALPLDERISLAEDFYRRRALAPTFKLTACSLPPDLDSALGALGYRNVESILKNGLDRRPLPGVPPPAPVVEHDNLRGSQYYQ